MKPRIIIVAILILLTFGLLFAGGCAGNDTMIPSGSQINSEGPRPNGNAESLSQGQDSSSTGNSESGSGSQPGSSSHGGSK